MIKKYKEVSLEIKKLNIKLSDKIKALLLSLLLSLIILIGPLILTINLFIFINYVRLLAFIVATIVFLIIFLTEHLYLKFIAENIKGKYILYFIDLLIPFIACYLTVIILIIKGVI